MQRHLSDGNGLHQNKRDTLIEKNGSNFCFNRSFFVRQTHITYHTQAIKPQYCQLEIVFVRAMYGYRNFGWHELNGHYVIRASIAADKNRSDKKCANQNYQPHLFTSCTYNNINVQLFFFWSESEKYLGLMNANCRTEI